jgi:hypothetical protein
MNRPEERHPVQTIRVDAYTRVMLTLLAALMTLAVIGLWSDHAPQAAPVSAAEPFLNTAAQRDKLLQAQKQTTERLDTLISLLRSGTVKVQIDPNSLPTAATAERKESLNVQESTNPVVE